MVQNINSEELMHPYIHSSSIYNGQECPSVGEWIKKLWFTNTMEYYTAERKKEFLPFVTARMEL